MDWQLRLMRLDDLNAIANVECTALHISKNRARNPAFIKTALLNNPNGCFVGIAGGCVVGYVITIISGNVGWIGSIEVAFSQGGNGLKLALLNEAINFLNKHAEITSIQLPNESVRFIQKSIELGFQLVEPQIILQNETEKLIQIPDKNIISVMEINDIFNVTDFMNLTVENNIAEIVELNTENFPAGKLLLETVSRRTNDKPDYRLISFGFVARNLTAEPLKAILNLAAKKASSYKAKKIFVALNGFYRNELQTLIQSGWKIIKTTNRLIHHKSLPTYKKYLAEPVVDLSQWTL